MANKKTRGIVSADVRLITLEQERKRSIDIGSVIILSVLLILEIIAYYIYQKKEKRKIEE